MPKCRPLSVRTLLLVTLIVCLFTGLTACSDVPLFSDPATIWAASETTVALRSTAAAEASEAPAADTAAPTDTSASATPPATTATPPATTGTPATGSTAATDAPADVQPAEGRSDVVYVSRSNIIHSRSNCSGMRYYTEMTLSQALSKGCRKCRRCW